MTNDIAQLTDNELAHFLVEAKRSTYATHGDKASVAAVLAGSKQLEHCVGELTYRDIYFGMFRFAGQEVVSRNELPIWTMVYAGGSTDAISDQEAITVFEFLRQALRLVSPDRPFRGPSTFKSGELHYFDESEGNVTAFHGTERITRSGTLVYRLDYAGGLIR